MKLASRFAAAALLSAVLGLGLYGIGRSLWLDEAWVANSILAPSLSGMFYYPGWLQTTPPLFLLLARAGLRITGPSNAAFRVVPLLFAILAAAGVLLVSRRLLRPGVAALATAIVVLNPTAIEYAGTLKPYSGEMAASAFLLLACFAYLQKPGAKRFGGLMAVVAVTLPLAYSTAFLVPGIVLALAGQGSLRRAVWLGALAAALLGALYFVTIRPNLSPDLHAYWAADVDHRMTPALAAALVFCALMAGRLILRYRRGVFSSRDWALLICVLPCLLLAAVSALGWYPASPRTRLFAVPLFVLLAAAAAEDSIHHWMDRPVVDFAAIAVCFGLAGFAAASQMMQPRDLAKEDIAGAVSFLQRHAAPADLILVHASCKEGFLLYSRLDAWQPPHALFGDTGWPCCARGHDDRPGASTQRAVFADLDAKIPRGYTGRVWLLFTTRPTHWSYTGQDEGYLWVKHVWERGCPAGPLLLFKDLAIGPMNCQSAR